MSATVPTVPPVPPVPPPGTDLRHEQQSSNADGEPPIEGPTDSHVLSQVEQDEKGLSQLAGNTAEITNLGWSQPSEHFQEPIIGGLSNEDLWMLIRRFDKVIDGRKSSWSIQLTFYSKSTTSKRCRMLLYRILT